MFFFAAGDRNAKALEGISVIGAHLQNCTAVQPLLRRFEGFINMLMEVSLIGCAALAQVFLRSTESWKLYQKLSRGTGSKC